MKLSEHFRNAFHEEAVEAAILDEIESHSPCGLNCLRAIRSGQALLSHVSEAGIDEAEVEIPALVEQICVTYIRG